MDSEGTTVTPLNTSPAGPVNDPERRAFPSAYVTQPWYAEPNGYRFDLLCYSLALLAVVFRAPIAAHQHSIGSLLGMRVSVSNVLTAVACLLLWSALTRFPGLGLRSRPTLPRFLFLLAVRTLVCTVVVGALLFLRHPEMSTGATLGLFFVISLVLLLLARLATSAFQTIVQPVIRRDRTVLIVGSGWRGQLVARQLLLHPKWKYHFFGFVDTDAPTGSEPVVGGLQDLEAILMSNPIDEVIVSLPVKSRYDEIQEVIAVSERLGIQSRYSTDLFATQITKSRSFDDHDPSSILLHMVHDHPGRILKRLSDILIASLSLILLAPVFLAVALAVKLTSPGPVLFLQKRYGLNKRLFTMYKFRSMVVDAERLQSKLEHLNETTGPAFKMKSDPRITRVGSFIRKTSLDELPQLWNVFIGNMSLVGPRPLPMRDVSNFSEAWLMRRFSVPPGITGLWQVSGRSNTSFAHWIKLDLDYIDRWSFLLDFHIIAKTFPAVLKRNGAV